VTFGTFFVNLRYYTFISGAQYVGVTFGIYVYIYNKYYLIIYLFFI
jgi:hypothetical protein